MSPVLPRFTPIDPPRTFAVGRGEPITLADCGRLALAPDEQVTFVTPAGAEYDVVRKAWGFYATPSLNGRLPASGLRAALVTSPSGKGFVFLVERGEEASFQRYLDVEQHVVLAWLDTDEALDRVRRALGHAPEAPAAPSRCVCGGDRLGTVFTYAAPPPGEVRFQCTAAGYHRVVLRCETCGHFLARHTMDTGALYGGDYVTSTYGEDGLRHAFERITALPPARSDNAGRVRRVLAFAERHLPPRWQPPTLLDVGSGLGVFVHAMRDSGWRCTALDPDPRAVRHARETVGVYALTGDFLTARDLGRFDTVTLNKVLEHVVDPRVMLRKAATHLAPGGFVYVEVPDGERAAALGPDREEFFVDHWHVFSAASLAVLAAQAGFQVLGLERLTEPSGKLTLRAFLGRDEGGAGA